MRRQRATILAAALAVCMAVPGCGAKAGKAEKAENHFGEGASVETTKASEAEQETEEEIDPETMDRIKYNIYVELNNDMVEIMNDIYYYYSVVGDEEEFTLLPDTGLTYGYRIVGKNTDTLDDAVVVADMEPSYGDMDQLVKAFEPSLRKLMETFSEISSSEMHGTYAKNQYQKPKELHKVIQAAVAEFGPLAYEYFDALDEIGGERAEKERAELKNNGQLIAYNASCAIDKTRAILDACEAQGVTDENINDLDLTEIRPLYDELVAAVAAFDEAAADNDQLMKESLTNSRPFDGLLDKDIQAVEWMMDQVESGQPIEDPSLEPLGSIAHVANTLTECIDRYNSVFVN